MLEGDYIADVEHHEWKKIILDENSNIECTHNTSGAFQFRFMEQLGGDNKSKVVCNMASYWKNLWGENGCFVSWNGYFYLLCKEDNFGFNADMTIDEATLHLKEILKEKNLIAYYKLTEPLDLELTSEQKAIREKKLHTYKNITNINLSDELASADVTYKKDLEAEHSKLQEKNDNLQSQIDEIKQLLSTTQTSALLLDNLQKDVESEVI